MTYTEKVLGYGPIAYWPQGEAAGPTAVDQVNSPLQDGTYTGVTLGQPGIGDGNTCSLFDGINDFCNIYSAAFMAAFSGTEGTLAVWAKVSGVGVWTDAAWRYAACLRGDGDNVVYLRKSSANNTFIWSFEGGNVGEGRTKAALTTTDWMHLALTWDDAANEIRAFYNGVQEGATMVNIGTWDAVPVLDSDNTAFGTLEIVGPLSPWDGYLAHGAVWDTPLDPVAIADLAVF